MKAFGPVPSRRLGRSLGVNNIPPKYCTYSCIYCQIGRTTNLTAERRAFYKPDEVVGDVMRLVGEVSRRGERIDYITFVPDGEPTLDLNLGEEIEGLKPLGIPIAVLTNGSLLWMEEVRRDLLKADWVSLKVDAASEGVWRRINRPHGSLSLEEIWEGMTLFAAEFNGTLATETMMVKGVNDDEDELEAIASFLAELQPDVAYIAVPTRPPAERWVEPASEESLNAAYQIFRGRLSHVELLIGFEGEEFAYSGDVERDILSITSVHPMREDALRALLQRAGADWSLVERLIETERLRVVEYKGSHFYLRHLSLR
ncbi:radical SAM protein [Candidatus Bathyarchaeota archaeon]|nr:radical SAM protein [Candidatus Bathyarchaeota archaeon]